MQPKTPANGGPALTSRQRLRAALDRGRFDRVPMIDLTYWPSTLQRWRSEGLPADPGLDLAAYFGLDRLTCINDLFNPSFRLPEAVLEVAGAYRIVRDRYGKVVREPLTDGATPATLEPAVRTHADWERLVGRLSTDESRFDNPVAEALHAAAIARDHYLAITPAEPFWFVLEHVMGFEHALRAVRKQRGLVAAMVATYTDYLLTMLRRTLDRGNRFDALWFWSDLCYRNGLLLSPRDLRELALPHWQRLGAFAHGHGMHYIWHCDGDVRPLIPLLLEAGVDALHPLEARAGNDVRELAPRFGDRLCLIGNIDADVVATNDPDRIEAEVAAKVPAAAQAGGYIYHIDHSVPPTVSLDTYRHLLSCVRHYGVSGRPAAG